jgi:hypothetical protein
MTFEATYIDGQVYIFEANNLASAYKLAGKRKPIAALKLLTELKDDLIWHTVYTRTYTEVLAYINAFIDGIPVASVPVPVVVEGYQKIKEVDSIAKEMDRISNIWPQAEIKVQKRFAK